MFYSGILLNNTIIWYNYSQRLITPFSLKNGKVVIVYSSIG